MREEEQCTEGMYFVFTEEKVAGVILSKKIITRLPHFW